MKPVAIFRHVSHEGPAYLGDVLDAHKIPWQLVAIDRGDAVPDTPAAYSGLVFMGGPMSANDDLPWIPKSLALIRAAVDAGVPTLGHCLGGQLMAKALGGTISLNPVKEIGWGSARVVPGPEASSWFGQTQAFPAFHWHGETFSIPQGAIRILETAHCDNQAFSLNGIHLALQCHVEMTEQMILDWCQVGAEEIAGSDSPGVQDPDLIRELSETNLSAMRAVADHLYRKWIAGLAA